MYEYNNNYKKKIFSFICFDWLCEYVFLFFFIPPGSAIFSSLVFWKRGILPLCTEGIATINSISRIWNNGRCEYLSLFDLWFVYYTIGVWKCLVLVFARLFPNGSGNWCKFCIKHNQHTFYVNFIACSKERKKKT